MSCLFNSIGLFLNIDGFQIRQTICNYLESNQVIMEGLDTKTILDTEDSNYVRKMRDIRVFGGGNEISAACNIWSLQIIVINEKNQMSPIVFNPIDKMPIKTIHLLYQNNNHYEAVVPIPS